MRLGRTIYVSNHPSSFMDPLVIAALNRPIVFFMTRSDVFTPLLKPILWASHMIPIYRQQDGGDTKEQNSSTFRAATKALKSGRNLLIFGEGLTDDVFIRRLKPIKKGAVRMGFAALEDFNWEKKVHIAAVGNNYSDPSKMRSQLLIAYGERICLNDFRESYQANPAKVVNELTARIEKDMQAQITHVENKDWSEFHEQIMSITRKGMNNESYDPSISLENRWDYSRKLAIWLNAKNELNAELLSLKDDLNSYFRLLKKLKVSDELLFQKIDKKQLSRLGEVLSMVILFFPGVLGFIHCAPIYFPVKNFIEKKFKRKVFWGSSKLVMGMIAMGLLNIPYIFLFHAFVYESWLVGFAYYWCIGLLGWAAYTWFLALKSFKEKGQMNKADTSSLESRRIALAAKIEHLVDLN
ncbi:MAG: 1-acyl-sn-glycerol-3-phosphate acyltransferase [Bacteroidota bacterium]